MWCFHSDGRTPDPVGVYRRPLAIGETGRRYTVRTAPSGEFIPYVVLESNERHGVYMGLEWSFCRIEAVTLASGTSPTVRIRGGNTADLRAELAPGEALSGPAVVDGDYTTVLLPPECHAEVDPWGGLIIYVS